MSKDRKARESGGAEPSERFLVESVAGGDEAALRELMRRYDRLVRFTVFRRARDRCRRDPQWLDAVASDTWHGFVRSLRSTREAYPQCVRAYLVRIAYNQAVSALRSDTSGPQSVDLEATGFALTAEDIDEASEALSRLELVEAVRSCLDAMEEDDRTLATQLHAILDRRWRQAAETLGMKESTLRSRWEGTLRRLRVCMQQKTGKSFAPGPAAGDP